MAPRETENNGYAKFWGDKQRALWYVMVFSGVVNCINSNQVFPRWIVLVGELRFHLSEFFTFRVEANYLRTQGSTPK